MKNTRTRHLRRGLYLLPSLFTVGNIFCGYVSIVRATEGEFEMAALLILIAALLDAVDGRVARFTGTTSEFGRQFDSIADVVSFGVAPAMLAFCWSLSTLGRAGWGVSFLFVMCGAMRLARFNIQVSHQDRRFFVGLPIPAAACTIATTVYAHPISPNAANDPFLGVMLLLLVALVSLLMVSRIKYRSFKDLDLRSRRSYLYLLIPAALFTMIALDPQVILMVSAFAYVLSGIFPRFAAGRPDPALDEVGSGRRSASATHGRAAGPRGGNDAG